MALQLLVSFLDHRLTNDGYSSFYNCTEEDEGVCVCVCVCVCKCVNLGLCRHFSFLFSSSPRNLTLTVCGGSGCPSVTPAVSQLLTPSMREAIAHEWQLLVIQRAANLSAILKKDFIYQSRKPKINILKPF